jgi:hypothetical protein
MRRTFRRRCSTARWIGRIFGSAFRNRLGYASRDRGRVLLWSCRRREYRNTLTHFRPAITIFLFPNPEPISRKRVFLYRNVSSNGGFHG